MHDPMDPMDQPWSDGRDSDLERLTARSQGAPRRPAGDCPADSGPGAERTVEARLARAEARLDRVELRLWYLARVLED